jgi:hypothetical protein
MQRERRRFPIERNGAGKKPQASAPNYALDNAVVVIEGMTNRGGAASCRMSAKKNPTQAKEA